MYSKIQCEGPAGLYFKQIVQDNLTISNLMFSNCTAESADGLPCGALILNTVFDLNLTNAIVENSTGYGLLGFNLLGNPLITDLVLKHNRENSGLHWRNVTVVAPTLILLHFSIQWSPSPQTLLSLWKVPFSQPGGDQGNMAVNDNYSCGDHSVLNQKHHQLIYFSNVTFDGNSARNSGVGLQIEDQITSSYLCAVQL